MFILYSGIEERVTLKQEQKAKHSGHCNNRLNSNSICMGWNRLASANITAEIPAEVSMMHRRLRGGSSDRLYEGHCM